MIEQHYRTPDGKVDIPFIYVYDGNGLTPGSSPDGNVVPIQAEDFLLRSVVGANQVADSWLYYNPSYSPAMGSGDVATSGFAATPIAATPRYTVVPEKFFPATSQILFDLATVTLAANADGANVGYIGWQGVKRVGEGQFGFSTYRTGYQYYERPYTYTMTVDVDFFLSAGAGPRQFNVEISDGDFELQYIGIQEVTTGAIQPLPVDPFLVTLFDPSGYMALSSAPCSPRWLNYYQGGNFFSCFPAPTLVYPVNSRIKIEVNSLINAAGGARQFQFVFGGLERSPC